MTWDNGVWYGIAFDVVLFGGLCLVGWIVGKLRRGKGEPANAGSGKRVLARIRRLIRPTLLLTPAREAGFSKLGGDPELPDGVEWPDGRAGPRTFLAQIDLAAFRPHGGPEWLPEHGRFYAFYDREGHGFPDVVRMLYSTDAPGVPRT